MVDGPGMECKREGCINIFQKASGLWYERDGYCSDTCCLEDSK